MKQSKHTPGPWKVNKACDLIEAENNQIICTYEIIKDAQLIACAPELLSALESIVETFNDGTLRATLNNGPCGDLFAQDLIKLITKAKGG